MNENNVINLDIELNIDELEDVSGGKAKEFYSKPSTITINTNPVPELEAYCKVCGKKVNNLGQIRTSGGITGVFKCSNVNCSEFNKDRFNTDVDFNKQVQYI